jgi:hypothetical protein
MLSEGRDYLFYRHARHAGAVVALIATRRFLFIIPHSEELGIDMSKLTLRTLENPDVPAQLAVMLMNLELTLDALESSLLEKLAPEHVIALDESTTLKVQARFFRRVRIQRPGRPSARLSLGSRRNHARFSQYYAA